jgi:prepilin-type N-terminal cleavage/methylation domain-containing protein
MGKWFHKCGNIKHRGENLPGGFTFSSRRGVTLVELMIAMLILTIVCISWLKIIGIQSARKEARRREAVERLAGMMDAFMYEMRKGGNVGRQGATYKIKMEGDVIRFETSQ